MQTIVVGMPTINDPDVVESLNHLFMLSSRENQLAVVVFESCSTYGDLDPTKITGFDRRIHSYNYHHEEESAGAWPARKRMSSYILAEDIKGDYALTLDSHVRFRANWDRTLMEQYQGAPKRWLGTDVTAPVLTGLTHPHMWGPQWEGIAITKYEDPWSLDLPGINPQLYSLLPNMPYVPARHFSACSAFGPYNLLHLWSLHGENVLFHGEEHLVGLEIFLQGWGLFHTRIPIAHLGLRPIGRAWEVDKNWNAKNEASFAYLRKVFHADLDSCDIRCKPAPGERICKVERYQMVTGLDFRRRREIPGNPWERWMDTHYPPERHNE